MARIRTIKPEFWTDEKLSECSLSARLLFVGLISHADDEGRMEFSPTRIRLQIFPCGKVTPRQLTEWLGELSERSLIRTYSLENKQYLDVPGFSKHQRINRPTPSRYPPYSMTIHGVLTEDSAPLTERSVLEGKGRELEGNGSSTRNAFDPSSVANLDPKAWGDWVEYRRLRKPPIKPESMQAAAEKMASLGERQHEAVKHSIANGYQGLVETRSSQGAPARKTKFAQAMEALHRE